MMEKKLHIILKCIWNILQDNSYNETENIS